jgi:hypothetical protein
LCNKWRSTTATGYDRAWRRWHDFCANRGLDPLRTSAEVIIPIIAEFLAYLSADELVPGGTINSYRSSLCGVYEMLLDRPGLARHPLLAGVVASAKRALPSMPRYEGIWDAALIPRYWSRTPARTLAQKRDKAISLGLITTYARPSDLARISRSPNHLQLTMEGYRFRIRGPKEGKKEEKLSPVVLLPFFVGDEDDILGHPSTICAATAWQEYLTALDASSPTRLPLGFQRFPVGLFLALSARPFVHDDKSKSEGKYHLPLGSERISKLMKGVMTAAGVDTSIFKGGSGRHAGASAAFAAGKEIDEILARGRWSSFHVFQKFYLRTRIPPEVLSGLG